ncbi:YidC/Oxa1 family membrane protein insertase [Candidatus Parcubacteria bacterium]|jgi:YidC/Oxa1 family membrane protein insertase|nr:YidC/Oxa1 family membrane protein insertase [Candidatus Parcubacteria bacterium]MBT3948741.1 YidC/Oxa1 family membrane protein insertase [Candidatus Parcubacteria bacterium]
MSEIFNAVLYQPIFNGFVALYNIIPDAGVVILIVTILIKLALYPTTSKSIKAQKAMTEIQPKLEEIKKKYANDKQKVAQETMKLYKENKVNPLGSCLPLLIQLPVFLALYWVLRGIFDGAGFELLYPFVTNPGEINPISLGILDLGKTGNIVLALLAGGAQFLQARMFSRKKPPVAAGKGGKDEGMSAMMNKQMMYFMPFITFMISFQFPAGLALYWFLSTGLTALQQVILFQKKGDDIAGGGGVIEGKIVK